MRITEIRYYDGAKDKIERLGLKPLFRELEEILLSTHVTVLEERDANGAAEVRERLDNMFRSRGGWKKTSSGGIDWVKEHAVQDIFRSIMGVEVQVSARSDLLIRDIVHLRNSIQLGEIDVGVIVVPDDVLQIYLPDRTPSFRDAVRYVEQEFPEAMNFPIIILAVAHDGPGPALPKRKRKR